MPPRRTWLTFLVILAINFLIVRMLFPPGDAASTVPYTLFKEQVAARNVERHRFADRVRLFEADLFPPHDALYRVIVSNPPYVISPESRYVFRDSGLGGDRGQPEGDESGEEDQRAAAGDGRRRRLSDADRAAPAAALQQDAWRRQRFRGARPA